jgi:sugar-specific transcriptional regulator TrmB
MAQEDDVIVLTHLGLTKLQAEVYLTLTKLGKATAKTVGTASAIDRANVYRVILTLQKHGLVEKTITTPTLFKAIDIQDAIKMLLKQKAKEYKEVEIKTKKMIKNYLKPTNGTLLTDECQFALIPENTEAICKIFNKKSEKTFDLMFCLAAVQGPNKDVRLLFKKFISRNVKVRILICVNFDHNQLKKIELFRKEKTVHFKDDPKFEVRYIYLNSPITLSLLDNKEALLNTSPYPHGTPSLWTNNPVLVSILHEFFEKNWLGAQKDCTKVALAT